MTAALLTGAIYDHSPTRAHLVNATRVPSVTQVLRAERLSTDFLTIPGLAADVLAHTHQLGEAVHRATHYYDEGDLVVSSVAPEVQPYLHAWMRFRSAYAFVPLLLERVVCSTYGYIGRLDRFGLSRDRYLLIDLKTGDPRDAAAHLQTAGYEEALRECYPQFGGVLIERMSVQLCPDGRYQVTRYRDRTDRNEFLAAVRRVHERTAAEGGSPCWVLS